MKYAYLYLLVLPFIVPYLIHVAVNVHRKNVRERARIAAKERREAERREAIRIAQEEREATKAAEEAAKAAMPKRKPGRPRKNPVPEQRPETISPTTPVAQETTPESKPVAPEPAPVAPVTCKRPAVYVGNNIFAGEIVAFTGTLPGMTRSEAIEAVKKNGGEAFDNMPVGTTILVVGERPGKQKLDNAEKWIGSCRKITAVEFDIMLKAPLTLEPDQFAEYIHAIYDVA